MAPFDPEHPDALLVAASPDLVEALRAFYEEATEYYRLNDLEIQDTRTISMARSALQKAGAL